MSDYIDLNKNGLLERCEDANFLHVFGNSKEYAKKYSHRVYQNQTDLRCEQLFDPYFGAWRSSYEAAVIIQVFTSLNLWKKTQIEIISI